jgi:hypothetical protein
VERARDLVALDGTACEVATHVPAVAVEDVDPTVRAAEHHEPLTEGVHGVRGAIAEIPDESEAVPSPRETDRWSIGLDESNVVDVLQGHVGTVLDVAGGLLHRSNRGAGDKDSTVFRSSGDWLFAPAGSAYREVP